MVTTDLIFYGGVLLCVGYLIFIFTMHSIKNKKRYAMINQARQEFSIAERDKEEAKKKLYNKIADVYGQEVLNDIKNGTIWIGMSIDLLMLSIGLPKDMKKGLSHSGKTEIWTYEPLKSKDGSIIKEVIIKNEMIIDFL